MSDSWDFSSVETQRSKSRNVVDQDMHLRINRVVDDLMVEGVNAALQELQRRSPPPSSSGETSAASFGSGWDSTHSSPFDSSPRSPFDRSLDRFAEPMPPQLSHSAGSSLRGSGGQFLTVGRGMRRTNSEIRPGPTGTL